MLIYGDPQFHTDSGFLARTLSADLERGHVHAVEFWRTTLIRAGQFEQGIEDLADSELEFAWAQAARRLTNLAAKGLHISWSGGSGVKQPGIEIALENLRGRMVDALEPFLSENPVPLKIKVPEGYEFYGLYPEQYCLSAQRWAAAHLKHTQRRVLVVGIRSIGTSLSAAVQATLLSSGWRAERLTVRPEGDLFNRVVHFGSEPLNAYDFGFVVDEGPGMSGSSIAATAVALQKAGIRRIYLFPGHEGEPGSAAAGWVREIWQSFPRLLTPLEKVRWDGMSWQGLLCHQSRSMLDSTRASLTCTDLSAGAWREIVFRETSAWPAVAATFERRKLLVKDERAGGVCWKFSGLGCLFGAAGEADGDITRTRILAESGLIPPPWPACNGFVGMPWLNGTRLEPADAHDPGTLEHLARYIAASAITLPDNSAVLHGFSRLEEMLTRNVGFEPEEDHAASVPAWAAQVRPDVRGPAYGDGRMAPYEWVRAADGALLKTDFSGHIRDHTIIGLQSWVWDLAGTVVEWNLDSQQTARLLQLLKREALSTKERVLRFFVSAYAASRLAMLWAEANRQSSDSAEGQRLERARKFYRRALSEAMTNQGTTLSART